MTNVTEEFDTSQDVYEEMCHGKAWPLPRRTPYQPVEDRYEVIVAGAGPAGLFLALLLSRLGLKDESLLCVDGKVHATNIGHADGVNGRTMEVLATVGLVDEVLRRGRRFNTSAIWKRTRNGLECQQRVHFGVWAPTRFTTLRAIHQARLERTMLHDMSSYSKRRVQYSSEVTNVKIDESDPEYPVVVTLKEGENAREVRTKYLVGADGAHSKVRRSMGISMEGDVTDRVWGVVEFTPESDFPDIRRVNTFAHEDNLPAGILVPREQLSNGDFMARFYVDMTDEEIPNGSVSGTDQSEAAQQKRAEFTKERIIEQYNKLLHPHYVRPKPGTSPYWWATYCIGQRLAKQFIVEDEQKHPRVFLMGDACHTHTPLQGQGLNISMQDAYNLAWKLAMGLFGLCPDPPALLRTYETERRMWAERVVFFDKRWNQGNMPMEEKYVEMSEQVTNVGVDYAPSLIIANKNSAINFEGRLLSSGVLKVGRRMFNVKLLRFADEDIRDIHDDFPMNGKHRIVILADKDFRGPRSRKAIEALCTLAQSFADNIVEIIVLQQDMTPDYGWPDLPPILKEMAEMRVYCADQEVYKTYGVDPDMGAVVLVRPDHHVSMTTGLDEFEDVGKFLKQILVQSHAN